MKLFFKRVTWLLGGAIVSFKEYQQTGTQTKL